MKIVLCNIVRPPTIRHKLCEETLSDMVYPIDFSNFLTNRRKLIPADLLKEFNARLVTVKKGSTLFTEGDNAKDYFQIESGQVKVYVLSPEGQEFTQGIFNSGESFGEPPLLGDFPYPSSAVMVEPGKIWKLAGSGFFQLLKENFKIHLKLDKVLCERLQYKSMVLTEVSSYNPEHRLNTLLNYFRSRIKTKNNSEKVIIPFTRQQLADMTGLRVETVIRTVKKMEREGKLQLNGHKILI